jgi:ribA/ribD-fused uncharacterized protein
MTRAIDRFSGDWRFLSNFYPSPFEYDGVLYATNEHFFNAQKSLDETERRYVADAPTPAEAKRRGRRVQLRPGWDDEIRYAMMIHGLALKFADPGLRRQLLETGSAELIEGTTWHDTHWGICICRQHGGQGQNHLGKMLMELRGRLDATEELEN